jgi:hypothetical protein
MKSFLAVAMLAAMVSPGKADSLFPGGPRFDGTIKLTDLAGSSCPPGQQGQTLPAVYRAKVKPSQLAEAMSVAIPSLAGALYILSEGDGTFKGTDQPASGSLILDAWRQALPNMVFNLSFSPKIISDTTPDFTFKGTVQNYTFPGCVATVRGTFFQR